MLLHAVSDVCCACTYVHAPCVPLVAPLCSSTRWQSQLDVANTAPNNMLHRTRGCRHPTSSTRQRPTKHCVRRPRRRPSPFLFSSPPNGCAQVSWWTVMVRLTAALPLRAAWISWAAVPGASRQPPACCTAAMQQRRLRLDCSVQQPRRRRLLAPCPRNTTARLTCARHKSRQPWWCLGRAGGRHLVVGGGVVVGAGGSQCWGRIREVETY